MYEVGCTLFPGPTQIIHPHASCTLSSTIPGNQLGFLSTEETDSGQHEWLGHPCSMWQHAYPAHLPKFQGCKCLDLIHTGFQRWEVGLGLYHRFREPNLGGTRFMLGIGLNTKLAPQGDKAWGEERVGRERGRLGGGLGAAGLVGNACHSSSVPTPPGSSTHQEREIESIPVRPTCEQLGTGGLETEPPLRGILGATKWPRSSLEDRKAAVSCFRCWGPWELLFWHKEASGEEGTGSGGLCGHGGLYAGCGLQKPARQPGLRLIQRSTDPWRRWWPPPLPRPHLPGRWWAASMVGSSRGFSLLG